jgi:ribonuclease P protein component
MLGVRRFLMTAKKLSFPKTRRLASPAEFARVRKNGVAQRGKFLVISALRTNAGPFRAGFVTSRKVGGAVVRNRVRRRMREIVRKHQHQIIESVWIVTIARETAARAAFAELEDAWLRLAKRASILAP